MDIFVSSKNNLLAAFNFLMSADGGFNWYGFLIGAGMVACIIICYIMGTKRGYYKDLVFDIAIICLPLAIVGARLYYVVFDVIGGGGDWTFKEIIGLGEHGLSGLAVYGGLIGAIIGAVIVHFWKRKKPAKDKATFLQMCDLAFTVVLLGQIVGRWGNFANQEAYGNLISTVKGAPWTWFPFAVFIDSSHAADGIAGYYQATFFYESFLNCFGLALLLWIYNGKRKSFDGFSLSVYCICYGAVRVFVEGLRSDSLYLFGNVRVSQLLSALLIIFGVCFIIAHFYRARSAGLKPFIMVSRDKLDSSYYGYDKCILSHPNVYEKKKGGFFARLFGKNDEPLPDVDALPENLDVDAEGEDTAADALGNESAEGEASDYKLEMLSDIVDDVTKGGKSKDGEEPEDEEKA